MISLIIPSHNNLRHLKNAYASIKKHAPTVEVILLDDGSTDGTRDWICELAEAHQHREVKSYRSIERVGHTILYDKGIEMATNNIVGIMHADMIMGPNYIENILKNLSPGKVVCGTRIEPPLHPEGKEKIIQNFGLDFDDLDIQAFESFCLQQQEVYSNKVTSGMFAPWVIYKSDFIAMGGHDAIFAPFPYEDSDIFQRWMIAGYELVQARDAFVYHLTCRGHRWTEQIQKDDDYYKRVSFEAARNYLRKWGSWIKNDEYQHPIIPNKYDIGYVIKNCNLQLLYNIEPLSTTVYVENQSLIDEYVDKFQKETRIDLRDRVKNSKLEPKNDIVIEIDAKNITPDEVAFIEKCSEILAQLQEPGNYELGTALVRVKNHEPKKYELPFLAVKNIF